MQRPGEEAKGGTIRVSWRFGSRPLSCSERFTPGAMRETMNEILQVRRAVEDDLPIIFGMIDEAAAWLRTKDTCRARIHDRGGDLRLLVTAWSCQVGDLVLVCESAEDLFSADPVLSQVDLRWPGVGLSGCELAEGTVRPGAVVMPKVFGQHLAQMMLIDDQQPAGKLPVQGTDDSLADGVRSGSLRWAGENPDPFRREYGFEGVGELAGAIPDQEPD